MPVLDFTLKIISPAFVAGTMEKEEQLLGKPVKHRLIEDDGLRVPSLRGVLRFWYRAKEGTSDTELLSKKEADIFGSTDKGQGLRLIPTGHSSWKPIVIGGGKDKIKGGDAMAYLGYGPLNYVSKDVGVSSHNKSTFRDAVPEGIVFHFRAIGNEQQLKELEKCLLLLHLFGGIGSRSRRAWGSLAVGGNFIPEFQKGESVPKWFGRILKEVWPDGLKQKNHLPSFSAFSTHSQIHISGPHNNYQEVMEDFHSQFKRMRLYNTFNPSHSPQIALNDHAIEVKDSNPKTRDISDVPKRIAFGMPYHPQSRNNNWEIEYFGYPKKSSGSVKSDKIDRRASPLLLKVFEGPGRKLYAVSLFLKAEFFGNSGVEIGKDQKGKHLPFPGWKAVEEFINNRDWQPINLP